MVLDDLALLVMNLDPANVADLERAEELLSQLPQSGSFSGTAMEKIGKALALVALLKTESADDFTATSTQLGQQLAALQEIMEQEEETRRTGVKETVPVAPAPRRFCRKVLRRKWQAIISPMPIRKF